MAITSTIARGYALRLIVIAIASAAFGGWGIYDYVHEIPRRQEIIARLDLLNQCRAALLTEQRSGVPSPEADAAGKAVNAELGRLLIDPADDTFTVEELARHIESLGPDGVWLGLLLKVQLGLAAERGLPLTKEAYPDAHDAYTLSGAAIAQYGEVTAPGKYDRIMQWGFISCLPFAPYLFWGYARTRRQVYRLEDDGTLHLPGGTWTSEEICDIDMTRWMAKSVAWVVNRDGTRVKLDDYKFKNLHLIVGKIAHGLAPDEWDDQARPRKDDKDDEDGKGGEGSTASPELEADDARPVIETTPTGSRAEAATGRDG